MVKLLGSNSNLYYTYTHERDYHTVSQCLKITLKNIIFIQYLRTETLEERFKLLRHYFIFVLSCPKRGAQQLTFTKTHPFL